MAEEITFNGTKYEQTFYDDFEGTELDSKKWTRCPEWQRQDVGGYWKNECSWVEDGNLVIEAKIDGDNLYSGAVRTKGKFQQGYGLYKIRFKAEKTSGAWYAFWLMNPLSWKIGSTAANGAEIDIFEIISNDPWKGAGKKQYLNSAVHWDGYGAAHKSFASQYNIKDGFYNEWHEITFEWTPEYYKAWLDDIKEPIWNTEGKTEKYGGINTKKNYVKITAEFGKWGGPIQKEMYPCHMYVDWVKVYAPKEEN